MHVAAPLFILLFLMLAARVAMAQEDFVLKAACIGGYANTVTEVAAAADGTISRRRYNNSGRGDRTWNPLGNDPTRVARWLKQVDAKTKQRRAAVPATVDRNPCRVGSSRPCHIVRRKGKVDYYACSAPDVVEEMMDFSVYTNAPRADGALDVIDRWRKALAASDVDALVKLFAPDAMILADNSKAVVGGAAEIRKYFEDAIRGGKLNQIRGTEQNEVLSEGVVLVTQYSAWTNPPSGQALPDRITFIIARQNGSWLIVHLHSSATPN